MTGLISEINFSRLTILLIKLKKFSPMKAASFAFLCFCYSTSCPSKFIIFNLGKTSRSGDSLLYSGWPAAGGWPEGSEPPAPQDQLHGESCIHRSADRHSRSAGLHTLLRQQCIASSKLIGWPATRSVSSSLTSMPGLLSNGQLTAAPDQPAFILFFDSSA